MIKLKLVCLLLVGIVSHLSCAHEIPDERYVKYKSTEDKISHEKLGGELAKTARQKNVMPYEIVNLLKGAQDKDKPKVVLDEFSVNDLLKLNEFSLSKCAENIFAEREAICGKLRGRHQPLFEYCTRTNLELSFWCIAKLDEVHRDELQSRGFTKRMMDEVSDLKRRVKRDSKIRNEIASSHISGNLERVDYENAIRRVFKRRGKKYEAKMRATCTKLVQIMSEYLNVPTDIQLYEDSPIDFNINTVMLPFNLCLIAINLERLEELARIANELRAENVE